MKRNIKLNSYKTIIFDCDGVILNSNFIKNDTFKQIVKNFYNQEILLKFEDFNEKNFSKSRYDKFKFLVNDILKLEDNNKINNLLSEFSKLMKKKLINCEVASGLNKLKLIKKKSNYFVITAGDQKETRYIFKKKQLNNFFLLNNIYGSPKNKYEIIQYLLEIKKIKSPILCIGDSDSDYFVSKKFGYDFVFIYQWTNFSNWKKFCDDNSISCYKNINYLFE